MDSPHGRPAAWARGGWPRLRVYWHCAKNAPRWRKWDMRTRLIGILFVALPASVGVVLAGEDQVRQAFGLLQKAVKARDADRIWELIDNDSQADAERAARA